MTTQRNKSLNGGIDGRGFVLSLAAAGFVVALLFYFSDLIAVPLREISSMISSIILKALAFPVTRSGTILTIGEMRFDVVPACSGSNTLQALIGIGIVWCCLQPLLSRGYRIAASLLSVPIALAANSIRVAMLAGSSYLVGYRIESGFLHQAIGIIAFVAGLGGFILLTGLFLRQGARSVPRQGARLLSRHGPSGRRTTWPEMSLRLSGTLLVFIFLPFLIKCLGDWKGNLYNRLDLYGYVFFFAGLVAFVLYWRTRPGNYHLSGPGSALFAVAAMPLVFTFIRSPNHYVVGASLLLVLFSLGLVFKGLKFSLSAIPLLIVIGLGYPKTTAFLNTLFGLTGIGAALCIKSLLSLFLPAATVVLARWWAVADGSGPAAAESAPARSRNPFRFVLALTACVFVIQLLNINIQLRTERIPLSFSYLQQDWVGDDRPLGEAEREFFREQNVLNRIYTRGDDRVGILIISSSCDRKKIHPPEYCQTGAGWRIEGKDRYAFRKPDGSEMEATRLSLFKEETGVHRIFVYWFSDGEKNFPDYPSLVIDDTLKMLSSKRSDWYLYAVWTDQEEALLEDFLSCLGEVARERAPGAAEGTPAQLKAGL